MNCEIINDLYKFIDYQWEGSKENRSDFFKNLKRNKYFCLFGAGGMGKDLANYFMSIGISIDFFCDNNSLLWEKEICNGIKCISFSELLNYKDNVTVIISTGMYGDIYNQLKDNQFSYYLTIPTSLTLKCKKYLDTIDKEFLKLNLDKLFCILSDDSSKKIVSDIVKRWFLPIQDYNNYNYQDLNSGVQYFPSNLMTLNDNEIFVDVGAYDGDTIDDFLEYSKEKFQKIIAYELDLGCYKELCENMKMKKIDLQNKIELYNLGLYSENKKINYSSNRTSSVINENADRIGEVVSLSSHLLNRRITFIKMDIEGAEIEALKGAQEIIILNKPKLAICIYHEPYHLWEIPVYLKQIIPEYKLYIRHHSDFNVDTVCYAIKDKD